MNRYINLTFTLIIPLTLICCGSKKTKPGPDEAIDDKIVKSEEKLDQESSQDLPADQFYDLSESIEDIQRQIIQLHARVAEYEYRLPEINYTEKLKALIDEPQPAHKIILKNGSVIEGTIEKDQVEDIMVITKVGKLIINKNEIDNIEDLILPVPDIIFIGHGQEEIFDNYHLFTGKVLNQGSHRGDFVRVIYQLWGEDTQIINSDSVFIEGTQVRYESGIVTDSALGPNQSSQFSVQVPVDSETPVSYVTREIHWLLYK